MAKRFLVCALFLFLAIGTVVPETELVLEDGRVIGGREVRREGDNYVVVLDSGETIVLPAVLVETVRLTGSKPRELAEPPPQRGAMRDAGPEEFGDAPPQPGALRSDGPQQLAGPSVRAPKTSEQLEVFGGPAEFQKDIVDNSWKPTTDWDMNPERQNNFAPSTWSESIVDNRWEPSSDWDNDPERQNNFAPSEWSESIIDNSWTPTDGFAR